LTAIVNDQILLVSKHLARIIIKAHWERLISKYERGALGFPGVNKINIYSPKPARYLLSNELFFLGGEMQSKNRYTPVKEIMYYV
jgi:hypothetical protein